MKRNIAAIVFLAVALAASSVEAQEPADLVVHNAKIFTADDVMSIKHAMAIRDGRIVAIGGEELVSRYKAKRTLDLGGRLVVPGFDDTHIHVRGYPRSYVDMQGVASIGEFQEKLRRKAKELGPGQWITGWGWSEDEFAEKRKPTRADLDAAIPENPAIIARAGGHSAVASSLALKLGGVTRNTPDPASGAIEKDAAGEPTGIFRESWGMFGPLIPRGSEEELRASLFENLRGLLAHGITSITEAMTGAPEYPRWQQVYARDSARLPRASVQLHVPVGFGDGEKVSDAIRKLALRPRDGDSRLRLGPLKIFVDGGYTGPAAWTLVPYRDQPKYFGQARLGEKDLYAVLKAANEKGWQVAMHTIGDAAIKMGVEQLAKVLDENPRSDHRNFLTHFTVMPPEATMRTMADHNIWIAQQPNFTYTIEGRYVAYLTPERAATNNPLRTPMKHGIFMAYGADIMPTGPLLGIYSAVTRKGMSGAVYGPGERVTVPEAIIAYTRNGAYFTFEEKDKGTLEPGKFGDFVVLSHDILEIEPDRILKDVKVDLTVVGGVVLYDRKEAR